MKRRLPGLIKLSPIFCTGDILKVRCEEVFRKARKPDSRTSPRSLKGFPGSVRLLGGRRNFSPRECRVAASRRNDLIAGEFSRLLRPFVAFACAYSGRHHRCNDGRYRGIPHWLPGLETIPRKLPTHL